MQTPFDPSHPAYDKWLREPLDDEERELMDPDNWDWDTTVEGRTIGTPGAILEIRLTREEYVALSRHARTLGISPHEFIKQAALERLPQHATR
jgi:hypothetical protein